MATIVNNPPASNNSGGGMGMIIGIIILLVVAYVFFLYGLPAIQQTGGGTPQINVPSEIDVNINQSK